MSASTILGKMPSEVVGAMAVSLSQIKHNHRLTLDDIGSVIGRSRESVSQYLAAEAEMAASCWLRAEAKWPDLKERLEYNLNEAERDFRARQRSLRLETPDEKAVAA